MAGFTSLWRLSVARIFAPTRKYLYKIITNISAIMQRLYARILRQIDLSIRGLFEYIANAKMQGNRSRSIQSYKLLGRDIKTRIKKGVNLTRQGLRCSHVRVYIITLKTTLPQ